MQQTDGVTLDSGDEFERARQPRPPGARRYVDTFFRHWMIALIPVLVLPVTALAVLRLNHGNATATMSVFATQDSTKQLSYANPLDTPASNLAAALGQLLQSVSFDHQIAVQSPLYWSTVAGKWDRDIFVTTDLGTHVKIAPAGPDLVTISYSNKLASVAVQVLQAIQQNAPIVIEKLNRQQVQKGLAFYGLQEKRANQRLAQSTKELGAYMKKHDISPPQMAEQSLFDPNFAARYQAVQSAQVDVRNAQQQLASAGPTGVSGSTFQVVDQPIAIPTSLSKKTLILDLGISVVVGILLSGAFVTFITARDQKVRHADEVPDLLGLPVLASVPYSRELARGLITNGATSRPDASGEYVG